MGILNWILGRRYKEPKQAANIFSVGSIELPKWWTPACMGIMINRCVNKRNNATLLKSYWGNQYGTVIAHAHNGTKDAYFGWICTLYPDILGVQHDLTLKPTYTFWHEYAHLLVPNENHTKKWSELYQKLHGHGLSFKSNQSWTLTLSTECCLYPLDTNA